MEHPVAVQLFRLAVGLGIVGYGLMVFRGSSGRRPGVVRTGHPARGVVLLGLGVVVMGSSLTAAAGGIGG